MAPDLERQVLVRLPVKSLLRFRAVCRSWSHLISSKVFINDHLVKSKGKDLDSCLLRYREGNQQKYLLCPDDKFLANWQSAEKLVPPFSETGFSYLDVGYCNGIICLLFCRPCKSILTIPGDCYAILWNPSIRKHLIAQIPYLNAWNRHGTRKYNFGFGLDSVSGDYKLVNMFKFWRSIHPQNWSLRDGKWNINDGKASSAFEDFEHPFGRSVFLNGKCHWLLTKSYEITLSGIISFDLHSRVLNKIALPDVSLKFREPSLHIFKNRLSFCIDTRNGTKDRISLWIMKEYGVAGSWVKIFESRNLTSVDMLIGLRSRYEVVYCRSNGQLISYGPVTRRIHNSEVKVDIEPSVYWIREASFYLDRYEETLSLLADYEDPNSKEVPLSAIKS